MNEPSTTFLVCVVVFDAAFVVVASLLILWILLRSEK